MEIPKPDADSLNILPPDENEEPAPKSSTADPELAGEDLALLTGETLDEAQIENYLMIAERELTAEMLAGARVALRERMRDLGMGDPMDAMGRILLETMTVKQRAGWVHAAVTIRDDARNERALSTPELRTGKGKGKGKKPKTGPKKSKRSTGWVRALGANVSRFRAGFGVDTDRLLTMLTAGGFNRQPHEIMSDPVYGFCLLTDPSGSTTGLSALPDLGVDTDWVVFGLRIEAKKGCPTHHFRYLAEAEATREAEVAGQKNASGVRIKELTDARVTAWYRTATPHTSVVPCSWHRPSWTLYVHSSDARAVAQAVKLCAATVGGLEPVAGPLSDVQRDGLTRTDLRASGGGEAGTPELGRDLLVWLAQRTLAGTGVIQGEDDGPRIEFWIDESVRLQREGGDSKKLGVRLAGAPMEGAALPTALAEGAQLEEVRLAIRVDERTWKLTVGTSGNPSAWRLPSVVKPDGTPEGLDAAVDERIRLHERGLQLYGGLVEAFLGQRRDRGTWRQTVSAMQRGIRNGIEEGLVRFIAATGQVALFADRVEMSDEEIEREVARAEAPTKPKGSRGRKARDAAGAAVGA